MPLKTHSKEELADILEQHRVWLHTQWSLEPKGKRANLSGSDLRGSNLSGSDLRDSNLSGSDLRGSDLSGSDLSDSAILPDGFYFGAYKREFVPALCVAGGKSLDDVANPETWGCNSWSNCPMHAAFDANDIANVPMLYRAQANDFIRFFDAGLIPLGEVNPRYAGVAAASCAAVEPAAAEKKAK